MWKKLTDAYWSKWLKKYHCKYANKLSSLKDKKVVLENNVSLAKGDIKCSYLKVGAYSYLRNGYEIYSDLTIGRFCSIANNVVMGLQKDEHPTDWLTTRLFKANWSDQYRREFKEHETVIGNDCWIGRDAIIMAGVTVGDGAIIGARSIVTKNIPAYAIAVGVPAKVIRYRFTPHVITRLTNLKWWQLPVEELSKVDVSQPETCIDELETVQKKAKYEEITLHKNKIVVV